MTCVFLTAIGGDIAQNVAKIIRSNYPEWTLIGSDIHDQHCGSLYVDKLLLSPPASDPTYGTWIHQQIRNERAQILLPLSEAEIGYFSVNALDAGLKVKTVGASHAVVKVGLDKLQTAQFFKSMNLPAPWTVPTDEINAIPSFPCIVKPRNGQGSKNIFICRNKSEARFFQSYIPRGVFQEHLLPSEEEVTCALYRFSNDQLAVLQLRRKLAGGTTGWAEVIDDDKIRNQCERVAERLNFYGPANIQLINTKDGPRIFEINPRFSSTVLMRHLLGFTDVLWALQEDQTVHTTPYVPPVGTVVVKTQDALVLEPPR